MKHILVTGGAGFIGSHLCEELLKKGHAVTALDNLLTGQKKNVEHLFSNPHFEFLEQDVCEDIDQKKWKLFQNHGLHGLLHFACPASPIDFSKIPFEILDVDSIGTKKTIRLAMENQARYVLASTSECYGDPLEHPQKEEYRGNVSSTGPRACYDEAKRFAEAYVSTATHYLPEGMKRLNGGMVRIFNTYGPRMRPNDGRVVPELCMQAIRKKPLTVHGDGLQTRSFCFVTDLVDGILRYFESTESMPVNLGNPVERTILDFAKVICTLEKIQAEIKHLEAREDDPRKRCPDITKAKKKLGWEPKVSLEEGLKKTLDYFRLIS